MRPAILLVTLAVASSHLDVDAQLCDPGANEVVVATRAHRLLLCEDGKLSAKFTVALGWGGVGKKHQGDGRTPLGAYPLGAPRASKSFGQFVPVGYPTTDQARSGFTGGAIGIHGPPRNVPFGWVTTRIDWTAGCIAVGSDDEIAAIAAWIRRQGRLSIRIT